MPNLASGDCNEWAPPEWSQRPLVRSLESQRVDQPLFHLVRCLYDRASVFVATNLAVDDRPSVFDDAKMATAVRSPHPSLRYYRDR